MVRPLYDRVMGSWGSAGLKRWINQTDIVLVTPECRHIPEVYEPEVLARAMAQVQPGAHVIDVGAHVGVYAVAFGKRVSPGGCVLAAEPDPDNLRLLERHIALNGLQSTVRIVPAAMSEQRGTARLNSSSVQSHLSASGTTEITVETLDAVTGTENWDLLLVDVEGHEEHVLRGGRSLLSDPSRRPSMIVMEVHPYAWQALGVSSATLLGELTRHGYRVESPNGQPVADITAYGHIIALAP